MEVTSPPARSDPVVFVAVSSSVLLGLGSVAFALLDDVRYLAWLLIQVCLVLTWLLTRRFLRRSWELILFFPLLSLAIMVGRG